MNNENIKPWSQKVRNLKTKKENEFKRFLLKLFPDHPAANSAVDILNQASLYQPGQMIKHF
jgi:hypothetical protein